MTSQSTEYAATPEPWKLPRNHPWWCPKGDLLHVPRALRRAKWTEKQWVRHREAQQRRRSVLWHRTVIKTDAAIFAPVIARKAEKERRAKRRLERLEIKAEKVKRRHLETEEANRVLDCIATRATTAHRIAKALDLDQRMVRRAIRRLLREDKIEKTSPKVYDLCGRGQAPKPVRRKRLPKRLQRKRL